MAYLKSDKVGGVRPDNKVELERKFKHMVDAKDYEVSRARKDSKAWEHLSEEEGKEILSLKLKLADLKRYQLYERVGWLLLFISLVLVQHQ